MSELRKNVHELEWNSMLLTLRDPLRAQRLGRARSLERLSGPALLRERFGTRFYNAAPTLRRVHSKLSTAAATQLACQ